MTFWYEICELVNCCIALKALNRMSVDTLKVDQIARKYQTTHMDETNSDESWPRRQIAHFSSQQRLQTGKTTAHTVAVFLESD